MQVLLADRPLWNYRQVARGTRPEGYARFWQGLFGRGVYCHPQQQECWFVSAAHTVDDVAFTVATAREALAEVRETRDRSPQSSQRMGS